MKPRLYFKRLIRIKGVLLFLISLCIVQLAHSQTSSVSGMVINENGAPLSGVTIWVKGTSNGTITNDKGMFTLNGVNNNSILLISSIGYQKQEIPIGGKTQMTITLKQQANRLDETVIMAYGTTTRRLNTGDISTITAKEIAQQPVSNPLAALEGRVPGLLVTQSNGVPGSAFSVQIRGQNSIAQGSEPLFIIDGVPFAPGNDPINELSSAVGSNGLSPFNSINPSDIQSIEVLKDADATAIYGSRGANGVVLITTKKGQPGKTKVTVNVNTGISNVTRMMPMMNTKQYLMMREEAFKNDGVAPNVSNAPDLLVWDTTRYTNFEKLLIGGTARTTNAEVSISGGDEQTQFLLSGGYNHQTTVFPGDMADNRGSFHINLNHNSKDGRLNISFSSFYVADMDNINSMDVTAYINRPPDTPPLYDSSGQLNWQGGGIIFNNPLSYLLSPYNAETNNLIGHLQLSYQLIPGLKARISAGYNTVSVNEINTNPVNSQNPAYNPQGYSQFGNNAYKSWIIEPQAEYIKHLGKLRMNVLIGGTWQQTLNESSSFFAYGYANDELLKSISAASSLTPIGDSYTQYHYEASFGRINLNWEDTYLLNISGRRDGSSRFGPGKQFGNFGAAGAAWIFSNERAVKNSLHFLSFGKLRASYGTTGNDQIPDYQYLDSWSSTNYPYNGMAGLYPSRLFNPDYSWEVNRKLEAAIELGFFKDNLQLSVSYFRNRSSNQLIQYALPSQTGFSSITNNFPATVQNTGWEFSITSNNITSGRFNWTTGFNLSIPENKLIAFPGLATSSYAGMYVVGKSLSTVRGLRLLGVDSKTGIFNFEDINNDGTINYNDYVTLGNYDPKFYGGINNKLSYGNWQFSFFFEFRKQWGRNYLASIYPSYGTFPGGMLNQPIALLSRWNKPGDMTNIQQFTATYGTPASNAANNFAYSSGAYYNASFIRLKTVALSYNLSKKLLDKIHVTDAAIYINAQNLLLITPYREGDPETQNPFILPPLRTITAGIQFTL